MDVNKPRGPAKYEVTFSVSVPPIPEYASTSEMEIRQEPATFVATFLAESGSKAREKVAQAFPSAYHIVYKQVK